MFQYSTRPRRNTPLMFAHPNIINRQFVQFIVSYFFGHLCVRICALDANTFIKLLLYSLYTSFGVQPTLYASDAGSSGTSLSLTYHSYILKKGNINLCKQLHHKVLRCNAPQSAQPTSYNSISNHGTKNTIRQTLEIRLCNIPQSS